MYSMYMCNQGSVHVHLMQLNATYKVNNKECILDLLTVVVKVVYAPGFHVLLD